MRHTLISIVLVGAALLALACVTVNVYFPEAEIKDLSEQIEDAVQAEPEGTATDAAGDEATDPSVEGEQFTLLRAMLAAIGPTPAYADQGGVANPEVLNPAIRRIIQSRRGRVQEIGRYKAGGVLGESNQALLVVRDLAALPLQERATVQKLVKEENADRERMFREIAGATGVDSGQIPQIRTTYAETLRQKARSGEWIQMPDGSWKRKS